MTGKRAFDESSITEAVQARFGAAPDPRLRAILKSLIGHLHGFVRDVEPTGEEWRAAVDFLARAGRISVDGRHEFILLSDALGASTLVDAINHRARDGATPSTVLGPFYVDDPPVRDDGADIADGEEGAPLYVDIEVTALDGRPLPLANVDVWQSDREGFYDVQHPGEGPHLRARFKTDQAGRLRFWTTAPTAYRIPHDGPVGDMLAAANCHPWRPAHVHFMIEAAGHETLVTHIFMKGDPYLESDAVFAVKDDLIVDLPLLAPDAGPDGRAVGAPWRWLKYRFVLENAAR
ncbi:MAG: dioxygenase [Pseudomonadota bacterium]